MLQILIFPIVSVLLFISLVIYFETRGKLRKHNELYQCKGCKFYFRRYQNSCIKCNKSYSAYKVYESYRWMDKHPDFPSHNLKEYLKFKKLEKLIKHEEYERKSKEEFMRLWNK